MGITTEGQIPLSVSIAAGEDLSGTDVLHKAIQVNGVIASGVNAFGLLQTKGENGEHVRLGVIGEMKGYANGAINSGSALSITTSGFVSAYTAIGSGGNVPVGKALESAASGDLFAGLFNFASFNNV